MDNFDTIKDSVSYVNIGNIINVFSSSEYDSVERAAAEIVDNAIDAEAKNICVYLKNAYNQKRGKDTLNEIYFLDDGLGMSPGRIQHIVSFGTSTRGGFNDIGKFGIGMNQASLFSCKTFEVYSWQSENEVYKQEFDSEYIKSNNIQYASPSLKTELPKVILNSMFYKMHCKSHGTLLVWKDLREEKFKLAPTVAKHMCTEFGRIYRNFLNDGAVRIIIDAGDAISVRPIDPMCLLSNNYFLGDPNGSSEKYEYEDGEPLFEPFKHYLLVNGSKSYNVPYYVSGNTIKISKVTISAASIKEKFYYQAAYKDHIQQPGETAIGKFLKKLANGITVVRNNREIDFNYFGFYDSINQPQDRWFKIQISFNQELDEIFSVSNNKQHVEIKKVSDKYAQDYDPNDPLYPIWLRLADDIKTLVTAMRNQNKKYVENAKNRQKEVEEEPTDDNETNIIDIIGGEIDHNTTEIIINEPTITIIDDDPVGLSESTEFSLNPNEQFYKKNNVVLKYDPIIKNIDFYYDYEIKKNVVVFNNTNIMPNKFSFDIEYMIVSLILEMDLYSEYSTEYAALRKLLDMYIDYIWGDE